MKTLVFGLVLGVFLFSCVGAIDYVAPPIPPTICQEFNKEESFLLEVQDKYNIPINEVYYGLIDTARILMITNVADKEWINGYLDQVAIFYNETYPNLTHDQLVSYMVSKEVWSDKITLILSFVSSRIGYFKSSMYISSYDDCLYRAGWSNVKKLLVIQ